MSTTMITAISWIVQMEFKAYSEKNEGFKAKASEARYMIYLLCLEYGVKAKDLAIYFKKDHSNINYGKERIQELLIYEKPIQEINNNSKSEINRITNHNEN